LVSRLTKLEQQRDAATDPAERVRYQAEIVQLLQPLVDAAPDNEQIKVYVSGQYGSLAWYYLFTEQFEAAEQAAQQGIALGGTEAEWINTNLALALLYQGKYEAAEAIYLRLKDQPYGDATYAATFLSDLDELEAAGITHEDVARVRQLLKK
jgi:tetratricopeptide (TPR) repeat protein